MPSSKQALRVHDRASSRTLAAGPSRRCALARSRHPNSAELPFFLIHVYPGAMLRTGTLALHPPAPRRAGSMSGRPPLERSKTCCCVCVCAHAFWAPFWSARVCLLVCVLVCLLVRAHAGARAWQCRSGLNHRCRRGAAWRGVCSSRARLPTQRCAMSHRLLRRSVGSVAPPGLSPCPLGPCEPCAPPKAHGPQSARCQSAGPPKAHVRDVSPRSTFAS